MARLNWRMEKLETLLQQTAEGLGYRFWGLEYLNQSGADTLRIYIEASSDEQGISPDDCAEVSQHLNLLLEVDKPISGNYNLEVSSPGMERRMFRLDQCRQAIGERIRIRLRTTDEGAGSRRNITGQLLSVGEDCLKVQLGPDEMEYQWSDLERVQLAPHWGQPRGRTA